MAKTKKAEGGAVTTEAGGNPKVFDEAKKRKAGGRVGKSVGPVGGGLARARLDKPGRKRGGRVGADTSPLSSAHNSTSAGKAAD